MEEEMSLRSRRKKSSVGIICCFTGGSTTGPHQRRASLDAAPILSQRWSAGWFKSKSNIINSNTGDHHHHHHHHHHQLLQDTKGKCRSFISRIGGHRRHASAEFSYDPLSYSLNFDDDADDDSRVMSFSARFPGSPRTPTPHAAFYDHDSPDRPGHLARGFDSLAENTKTSRDRDRDRDRDREMTRNKTSSGDDTPIRISPNPQNILLQMSC